MNNKNLLLIGAAAVLLYTQKDRIAELFANLSRGYTVPEATSVAIGSPIPVTGIGTTGAYNLTATVPVGSGLDPNLQAGAQRSSEGGIVYPDSPAAAAWWERMYGR